MVVIKLKWDIVEEYDKVLLVIPDICVYYTHQEIINSFRESIQKIKCKFLVIVTNKNITKHILKYEELYDKEFQWITDISTLENEEFLKHNNQDIAYMLQNRDFLTNNNTTFFTKIIINTLDCEEIFIRNLKSLKVPIHYGICVFQEIINMNIFMMNGTISLIIGKTSTPIVVGENVDLIFNCNGHFIKGAISYEEPIICIDVFSDLMYRLGQINTTPIFIGEFSFYNSRIETRWNSYFSKKLCIYDIDAFQTLKPQKNFRLSKDIPNLLKMFHSKVSDILQINL
jgi:hypothetical protein